MEYPKVLFHDSENTSFAWRDGYANIPTEILEALLEETRRATCSIEDELRQRGSVSATTSRVDNCLLRIRKDAELIKICGRLDERSAGAASDLHSVMHTVQTDRNRKVYQQFLNDVLQHCGPECTLLCGVSLGRHKIANLRRDERASLLKHLKKECRVFSVEPITSLSKASRLGKFEGKFRSRCSGAKINTTSSKHRILSTLSSEGSIFFVRIHEASQSRTSA